MDGVAVASARTGVIDHATFTEIPGVIDAYRIETLKPYQLGVGSGMSAHDRARTVRAAVASWSTEWTTVYSCFGPSSSSCAAMATFTRFACDRSHVVDSVEELHRSSR